MLDKQPIDENLNWLNTTDLIEDESGIYDNSKRHSRIKTIPKFSNFNQTMTG